MDCKEVAVHRVRAAALGALGDLKVGRKELLEGLADCRRMIESKAVVERVITAAGYQALDFCWNEHLEVYFNLADNQRHAGCISKGWEDRGYRLANALSVPLKLAGPFNRHVEELRQKCATEGIALTTTVDESELAVALECVIYEAGFNPISLGNSLGHLVRCGIIVQDSLNASAADTLTA